MNKIERAIKALNECADAMKVGLEEASNGS